jgi:acyl-CoA dehydrogenase
MNPEAEVNPLVDETVNRLLSDVTTFEVIEQAEVQGWSEDIWQPMAESGFPWVGVPESAGGTGGSLLDAAAVLRQVGAHGAPVPVAETGLLAGWLLAGAGLEIPSGPATVVGDADTLSLVDGRLRGTASVAWAARSDRVATLVASDGEWLVASIPPERLDIERGANLAGEPRDQVTFDVALDDVDHRPAGPGCDAAALRQRGALSRVVMAAGAMQAMSQMTVDYTHERHQFGKPVATFQAVQMHLIRVAQSAVRLSMAADLATRAMERGAVGIEVAAAKVVADETSLLGTRAAHQAHGAMGVTREYPLHHLSRRLWAWRHEYGQGSYWRRHLGAQVFAAGPDELFPLIAGGAGVR